MEIPTTRKSPGLELVSTPLLEASAGKDAGAVTERRRRPRVALTGEQFRLSSTGKVFSVMSFSERGMALHLLDSSDFLLFPIGAQLEGTLKIRGGRHPVRAKVMNIGTRRVGCEFEGLDAEVARLLAALLDPVALGREIRPVPAPDGKALWYHGPCGTDLLFSRGMDGQISKMLLYALGSFVEWDEESGELITGRAQAASTGAENTGVVTYETVFLEADAAPDPEKLRIAKEMILSSNLSEDLKGWCSRRLRR